MILNSAQEKISNPDPGIFLLACKKLEVKSQDCFYIDDHPKHAKAAKFLGVGGIFYAKLKDLKTVLSVKID